MASYDGTPDMDEFTGTSGDDTFNEIGFFDIVEGAGGTDVISVNLASATANVTYSAVGAATGSGISPLVGMSIRNIEKLSALSTGSGHDKLIILAANGAFTWQAGAGSDTLELDYGTVSTAILAGEVVPGEYRISTSAVGASTAFGIEAVRLKGGTGADQLIGTAGNDSLDGGGAADTLTGGLGNDTYVVSNAGDVVVELDGGGIDFVSAAISYTLGDNIENMGGWYGGTYTGNGLDNTIYAGVGANVLNGLAGNDTLSDSAIGGAGSIDTFNGGDGDDLVTVGHPGLVVNGGDGYDTFWWQYTDLGFNGITVDLNNVISDIGDFSGIEAVKGTSERDRIYGDGANNDIWGYYGNDTLSGGGGNDWLNAGGDDDSLTGGDGNDTLLAEAGQDYMAGGAGADILTGGQGDDTYHVDNAGDKVNELHEFGTDTIFTTVSYSLFGRAVEILTMSGTGNLTVTGNSLNNILTGNDGNNGFDGAGGADKMTGGLGNDTYYVDNVQDNVAEQHLQGTDSIFTSVSYSLFGRAVETLTMLGSGNLSVTGNSLGNLLTGNDGNNSFDGAGGADTMIGGLGDDTYYVDNISDKVAELHLQGTDTVFSSVTYSFFGRAAEILTLTGSNAINGTGNSLANTITGNSGANRLDGAGGNDSLSGGEGLDTFLFVTGSGADTVVDFRATDGDLIDLHALTGGVVSDGLVTQAGDDVVIDLGGGTVVLIQEAVRAEVLSHIVW